MTRRIVLSLVGLFMLALAVPSVLAEDPTDVVQFRGTIVHVGMQGIAVETDRGVVRVHVNERTVIYRNGERARLGALQEGDHASVRAEVIFRDGHRRLLAHEIRARGR